MPQKATTIGSPFVLYVIYNTFATLLLPSFRFVCVLQWFMGTIHILYVIYNTFETLALASLRFCMHFTILSRLPFRFVCNSQFV